MEPCLTHVWWVYAITYRGFCAVLLCVKNPNYVFSSSFAIALIHTIPSCDYHFVVMGE